MNRSDIRKLQRGLNFFTVKYLDGIGAILVDGKMGKSTKARIRTVKYYLGYAGGIAQQNSVVNDEFLQRMWHPKSVRYSSVQRVSRGARRRVAQRRRAKKNANVAIKTTGVGRFDGKPVANVMIPHLKWARANGWRGVLVSGWRDPVYSRGLCMNMCGRPSCPGRCAGLASNHVGNTPARFAGDVSDYQKFGQLMRSCPHKPRIFNTLGARDPVHFSPSGN